MSNTNSVANPGRPAVLGGGRKVDRVALLEKVAELGSISAAAKAAGVSYKGAWEAIEALNNLSDAPVVERLVGGSGGGDELAAIITNESAENLGLAPCIEAHAMFKASWVIVAADDGAKTSVRNRLCGTVARVVSGPVSGEIVIDLPGGKSVAATITRDSIDALGLKEGAPACALIKAAHVILAIAN